LSLFFKVFFASVTLSYADDWLMYNIWKSVRCLSGSYSPGGTRFVLHD